VAILCSGISVPAQPASDSPGLPIAKIKESVICCPLDEVVLDGWASIDVGGEIVRWLWDLNGDGAVDTSSDAGELRFSVPRQPGSRLVILTVKDNDGNLSGRDTATLHVMNSPPRVIMEPDTVIRVGVRLFFEPRVESHCSEVVSYEWDFNDDGRPEYRSSDNGNTSRIYYKPGKYYARLKVTDTLGKEVGGIRTIHVTYSLPR
jgi:hypothetical protein